MFPWRNGGDPDAPRPLTPRANVVDADQYDPRTPYLWSSGPPTPGGPTHPDPRLGSVSVLIFSLDADADVEVLYAPQATYSGEEPQLRTSSVHIDSTDQHVQQVPSGVNHIRIDPPSQEQSMPITDMSLSSRNTTAQIQLADNQDAYPGPSSSAGPKGTSLCSSERGQSKQVSFKNTLRRWPHKPSVDVAPQSVIDFMVKGSPDPGICITSTAAALQDIDDAEQRYFGDVPSGFQIRLLYMVSSFAFCLSYTIPMIILVSHSCPSMAWKRQRRPYTSIRPLYSPSQRQSLPFASAGYCEITYKNTM